MGAVDLLAAAGNFLRRPLSYENRLVDLKRGLVSVIVLSRKLHTVEPGALMPPAITAPSTVPVNICKLQYVKA